MKEPGPDLLHQVMELTWPAAGVERLGPWLIRDGQGGGQRVSAATAESKVSEADIAAAEDAMARLGQPQLFMLRPGDEQLNRMLAGRGYRVKDPVVFYSVPVSALTAIPVPRVSAFHLWPPLAIMVDLWAEGGVGATRLAVMDRVSLAKTAILARNSDQPAGAAFVAISENVAMIHAIEVTVSQRRQGVGANILRAAAHWAQDRGASHLTLAVTRANAGANALYTSQGMTVVGHYHYRIK